MMLWGVESFNVREIGRASEVLLDPFLTRSFGLMSSCCIALKQGDATVLHSMCVGRGEAF
jgi:hypothetical protein